jgi:hypothetical protein
MIWDHDGENKCKIHSENFLNSTQRINKNNISTSKPLLCSDLIFFNELRSDANKAAYDFANPRRQVFNRSAEDVPYDVQLREHLEQQTKDVLDAVSASGETVISELRKDHNRLEAQNRALLEQLADLRRVNKDMSELISRKYNAKSLFLIAGVLSLSMLGAILLNNQYEINIIQPLLARVGLLGGVGFCILAIWKYGSDRESN